MKKWIKEGFEEFRKGSFGNGGHNIYVSKKGVLQRIYNYDLTGNGYPDLPVANSHRTHDRGPLRYYPEFPNTDVFVDLPTNGISEGFCLDLNGDGYVDAVCPCQGNGTHSDNDSVIYFGSPDGLSEDFRTYLYTPNCMGATAGDYSGKGVKDVCFVCQQKNLKIFNQVNGGYDGGVYYSVELDKKVESLCTYDVNRDGYEDLYCKLEGGECVVFWGGENGISKDNFTSFYSSAEITVEGESGPTASRAVLTTSWRASIVTLDGEDYLVAANKENLLLYTYNEGNFEVAYSYACDTPVYAIGADLDKDGKDDLIIACASQAKTVRDPGSIDDALILWNYREKLGAEVSTFKTNQARSLAAGEIGEKMVLAVAQTGHDKNMNVDCQFLTFEGRSFTAKQVMGEDCNRILIAKFNGRENTVAMVEHEWADRVDGHEEIYIFRGDENGYRADDRIELMGRSAVDSVLADFNDDGRPDVLVVNCNESEMSIDWGSFLYYMNEKGEFDPKDMETLATIRAHGCAIGDFYHTGYLDVATSGIMNREVRILKGGPDGYSTDRMQTVAFGPDPEKYSPAPALVSGDNPVPSLEEREILKTIGEQRWMYPADFNGDGWLDIFVSSCMNNFSYILFGGPEGYSLDRSQALNVEGAISANVADLNKDGYPDLVVGCHHHPSKSRPHETYIYIYWGGPDGFSEARKTALPIFCANSVSIGDFNGDGWLDIFATSYNNGRYRDLDTFVYYNDHGHFSYKNKQRLFNHSGCGCLAGDFNHDGYCDLLVVSHKDEGDHRTQSYVYYGGPSGLDMYNRTELPSSGPHGASAIDPGNVMDRGEREYYTSEKYVTEGTSAAISYVAECTSTSYIELEYRTAACDKCIDECEWISVQPGEAFKIDKVMQYRVALGAKCGCGTPRISKIEVTFN